MRFCKVATVLALILVLTGCGGDDAKESPETGLGEGTVSLSPSVPTQVNPTQVPIDLSLNRILIASIGVDAPLSSKVVPANRSLPNPDGPDDAVLYDFAALGGFGGAPGGGNVVISAKLDSGTVACQGGNVPPPCFAAFGSLASLKAGAKVQIVWEGKLNEYTILSSCWVANTSRQFESFVKTTDYEAVTLLTAAGNFDETRRGYSHTLVVRGTKQAQPQPLDCGDGSSQPLPTATPSSTQPRSPVSIVSAPSSIARGQEATVIASANSGTRCGINMQKQDAYRVLGFTTFADSSGKVEFGWRIAQTVSPGDYILEVDCGQGSAVTRVVVS
jgi:hypothetical protein